MTCRAQQDYRTLASPPPPPPPPSPPPPPPPPLPLPQKHSASTLEAAPRHGLLLPLLPRGLRVSVPEVWRHKLGERFRILIGPRPRNPTASASGASPAWSTRDNEDSCGARAQGRPSNRKSEHHLRVHRAAAPAPRAAVRAWRQQKRAGPCWPNAIWNCRTTFGFSFN